ncbi:MAG: ABC transporter permease, partial [Rhodoferax sp.]
MGNFRAYLFVLPLLIFLLLTFFLPIGNLLLKSIKDTLISQELPKTVALLGQWDSKQQALPSDVTFAALAEDLAAIKGTDGPGKVAMRLNFDQPGMRSLVLKTARSVDSATDVDWRARLEEIDERWGHSQTWVALKYASKPWTLEFYLKAFDLTRDGRGNIVQMPEDQRLYRDIFMRTAWIGLSVSLLCLLFAYPVAYFLVALPARISNVLM